MGKVKDLTGQSFGRLTVVKQIGEYEMATGYSNSIESVEESPTIIEAEGSAYEQD